MAVGPTVRHPHLILSLQWYECRHHLSHLPALLAAFRASKREVTKAMKEAVVLYPLPAIGHLVSMVELAKLFLLHDFSVTVVLMDAPISHPSIDSVVARVSSAYPSISFHRLPPVSSVPDPEPSFIVRFFDVVRLNNPQFLHFVAAHSQTYDVRAVVLDFFCSDADVTAELRLPSYFFWSSGAAALALFLYIPTLHFATHLSFKDLDDAPLHVPGLPPVSASHMPHDVMDRNTESYKRLFLVSERGPNADGLLINTFESMEVQAVRALRDGSFIPGRRMPPVYCIGPLVADWGGDDRGVKEEKAECVAWLDAQPRGSVVFLCFGSMGTFRAEQFMEIASGLERSGQRFLWVVRAPESEGEEHQASEPLTEPDLETLLPEGFLERTKQRGLVVKSWAPQVEVLNHRAVGGFVTHCGWNSVMEAIMAGVAMVAWPLYAEQKLNKVFLVEQMRLAVAMEGYDKELVAAEEVEAKIRWLMESEGGQELRARAAAMKERAVEATREGGSSQRAWLEVVKSLRLLHGING
ncbi:hypothetical protein GW17_00001791 [Ensete ventricosum]|nr:hypothetical protein GW17_00001791 [Ensete ventricosum]